MKIEFKDSEVITRVIVPKTGNNAGQQVTFYEQTGWVQMAGPNGKPLPYPERINVQVENGKAYSPGVYQISPESFYIDRYGKLSLGRLKLSPLAARAAA